MDAQPHFNVELYVLYIACLVLLASVAVTTPLGNAVTKLAVFRFSQVEGGNRRKLLVHSSPGWEHK